MKSSKRDKTKQLPLHLAYLTHTLSGIVTHVGKNNVDVKVLPSLDFFETTRSSFVLPPLEIASASLPVIKGDIITFQLVSVEGQTRDFPQNPAVSKFTEDNFVNRVSSPQALALLKGLSELDPGLLEEARACPAALVLLLSNPPSEPESELQEQRATYILTFLLKCFNDLPTALTASWAEALAEKNCLPLALSPHGLLLSKELFCKNHMADLIELAYGLSTNCRAQARFLTPLLNVVSQHCPSSVYTGFILKVWQNANPLRPGDDLSFATWNEYPKAITVAELLGDANRTPALWTREALDHIPGVILKGPYESKDHYLQTYFRLYRADCFTSLSKQLTRFLKTKEFDPRDLAVFDRVRLKFDSIHSQDSKRLIYTIVCRPRTATCVRSNNLSFGNLLALTIDGTYGDVVWATLASGVPRQARRRFARLGDTKSPRALLELDIQFCTEANGGSDREAEVIAAIARGSESVQIVENNVFFLPYEPILSAIKDLANKPLPFEDQFVKLIPATQPKKSKALMDLLETDKEVFASFDPQQMQAYQHFAEHKMALIQGPPGTGKSYLGARIVYSLVKTGHRVLVMSFKNHGLDDLLLDVRDLLKGEEGLNKLVRVGRNPKMSQEVAYCTLENVLQEMNSSKRVPKRILRNYGAALDSTIGALQEVTATLEALLQPMMITMEDWINFTGEKGERAIKRLATDFPSVDEALDEWSTPILAEISANVKGLNSARRMKEEYLISVTDPSKLNGPEIDDEAEELDEEAQQREAEEAERKATMIIGDEAVGEGASFRLGKLKASEDSLVVLASFFKPRPGYVPVVPEDLSLMEEDEKMEFFRELLLAKHETLVYALKQRLSNYNKNFKEFSCQRAQKNASCLRERTVIGCTVHGASIFKDSLVLCNPDAIVIEESAEIVEPALIASLVPSLKHIVMIGDHQQLRASIASYDLKTCKNLDVSAFERLITDPAMPSVRLLTQNRMLPYLLPPVTMHYEGGLTSNMEIVGKLSPPEWLEKPLFWWTHSSCETSVDASMGHGLANPFEVERAVFLALFLLRQGVDPATITILSPYLAQVQAIRSECSRRGRQDPLSGISSVQIATVDEFLGAENEIIILSLVRSNTADRASIGFLSERNRQIVATSRQKTALIIIGNHNTFTPCEAWNTLIKNMTANDCLDQNLPLKCPRHDQRILVDKPSERSFDMKGCGQNCMAIMDCGHQCPGTCHSSFYNHTRCDIWVDISLMECKHTIRCRCGQLGGESELKCHFNILKQFPCGHKKELPCWKSKTATCYEDCTKTCSRGHPCLLKCCQDCNSRPCPMCLYEDSVKEVIALPPQIPSPSGSSSSAGPTRSSPGPVGDLDKETIQYLVRVAKDTEPSVSATWEKYVPYMCRHLFMSDLEGCLIKLPNRQEYRDLENRERVLSIILTEHNLRLPEKWDKMPQAWVFLAMVEEIKPGTLTEVRAALAKVLTDTRSEMLEGLDAVLRAAVRSTENRLVNFIGGRANSPAFMAFSKFKETPIQELASKVTMSVGAQGLAFMSRSALNLATSWGMFSNFKAPNFVRIDDLPPHREVPKKELYTEAFSDQYFVSLDIRAADFNALKLLDSALVAYCDSWKEFSVKATQFLDETHRERACPGFEEFKGLRTRVLGQLCHIKNAALQSHLLRVFARAIAVWCSRASLPHDPIQEIFRFSVDELCIVCKSEADIPSVKNIVRESLRTYLTGTDDIVRVEAFQLKHFKIPDEMLTTLATQKVAQEEDDLELVKYGHSALRRGPYREEIYNWDDSWAEYSKDRRHPPYGSFFVRSSIGVGGPRRKYEPKCLPKSLKPWAFLYVLEKEGFSPITPSTTPPPPAAPSSSASAPLASPPPGITSPSPLSASGGKSKSPSPGTGKETKKEKKAKEIAAAVARIQSNIPANFLGGGSALRRSTGQVGQERAASPSAATTGAATSSSSSGGKLQAPAPARAGASRALTSPPLYTPSPEEKKAEGQRVMSLLWDD